MKTLLIAFFFASIFFLIIDIIWLSITVKLFYRPQIGHLLTDKPIFWAAALFYFISIIGLSLLVLQPALVSKSVFQAFWTGAVFGVVAYGTYNLTNMATIKNWSPYVVIIDTIWGGLLTGFVSTISIYLTKKIYF